MCFTYLDQKPCRVNVENDVMILKPKSGRRSQGPVDGSNDRPVAVDVVGLVLHLHGHVDRREDELDFEELGDVEEDREDDDRHDVGEDDPSPWVDALALVVVLDRPPDSPVPLQGQRDRDVDGAAEDEVVKRIEAVTESIFVNLRLIQFLEEITHFVENHFVKNHNVDRKISGLSLHQYGVKIIYGVLA
jgi:hypothetical protein